MQAHQEGDRPTIRTDLSAGRGDDADPAERRTNPIPSG